MSGNSAVGGAGNSPTNGRALVRRFGMTLLLTLVALAVFTICAWALRKWFFTEEDWQQYVSAAALLVGVGGAFGLGAVVDGGLKESANVTAITGIAAGGVMMAYKEISELGLGDGFFLKALALFGGAYLIMFGLAVYIENRPGRNSTVTVTPNPGNST